MLAARTAWGCRRLVVVTRHERNLRGDTGHAGSHGGSRCLGRRPDAIVEESVKLKWRKVLKLSQDPNLS